jgi:hypothetical protein
VTQCPTYLLDIGPNLLQVLVQLLTLAGVVYGVTRVLANGQAVKTSTAAIIANGKPVTSELPK